MEEAHTEIRTLPVGQEGTARLEDSASGSGLGETVILGDAARGRECDTARQGKGHCPGVRKGEDTVRWRYC